MEFRFFQDLVALEMPLVTQACTVTGGVVRILTTTTPTSFLTHPTSRTTGSKVSLVTQRRMSTTRNL